MNKKYEAGIEESLQEKPLEEFEAQENLQRNLINLLDSYKQSLTKFLPQILEVHRQLVQHNIDCLDKLIKEIKTQKDISGDELLQKVGNKLFEEIIRKQKDSSDLDPTAKRCINELWLYFKSIAGNAPFSLTPMEFDKNFDSQLHAGDYPKGEPIEIIEPGWRKRSKVVKKAKVEPQKEYKPKTIAEPTAQEIKPAKKLDSEQFASRQERIDVNKTTEGKKKILDLFQEIIASLKLIEQSEIVKKLINEFNSILNLTIKNQFDQFLIRDPGVVFFKQVRQARDSKGMLEEVKMIIEKGWESFRQISRDYFYILPIDREGPKVPFNPNIHISINTLPDSNARGVAKVLELGWQRTSNSPMNRGDVISKAYVVRGDLKFLK